MSIPTPFIARFQVDGADPVELTDIGDWADAMLMRKSYTSGIIGTGVLHFVYSGTEASRGYLAVERITGEIDEIPGEVTVHHGGLNSTDDPTSFAYIVPGTGTGVFESWAGMARIVHDDEGPYFEFTLA